MRSRFCILALLLCLLLLFLLGQLACSTRQEPEPLPTEDIDYVLVVLMDISESYVKNFQGDDAKAFKHVLELVAKFFKDRKGSNDKLILGQISANPTSLIWIGQPADFRTKFANARAFNQFLLAHSDPAWSRVNHAIADSIEHVLNLPGVESGRTRSLVTAFTDMEDNVDTERSKDRLLETLRKYSQHRGRVGLYWVSQRLEPTVRQQLKEAGFLAKRFLVVTDIEAAPRLPDFD